MFQSVLRRVRGPQPKTQAAYEEIIEILAAGKPAPANVEEVLEGREAEDAKKDTRTRRERGEAAAILSEPDDSAAQHAEAAKAVENARQAIENHPWVVAQREVAELQRKFYEAQVNQSTARSSIGSRRAQARNFLLRTSSRSIDKRIQALRGNYGGDELSLEGLQGMRASAALSEHDLRQRSAMEQSVATLPVRISKADAGEAIELSAELMMAKNALKRFSEREKVIVGLDKEIAKLEKQREKLEAERLRPECMEYASKPRSVEL